MPNHSEEHSAKDKKFVKSVFASVVHLYGRSARGATRDKCSKNRGDDRETRRSTKQTRLASLFNSNIVKLRRCKVSFNWINLSNDKNRCQKTFHNVTSLSISKHQKDEFDSFPENLTRFIYTGLATFMILIMIYILYDEVSVCVFVCHRIWSLPIHLSWAPAIGRLLPSDDDDNHQNDDNDGNNVDDEGLHLTSQLRDVSLSASRSVSWRTTFVGNAWSVHSSEHPLCTYS